MIRVLNPGMLTTIQDGGRYGYQRFGVPVCGAMDAQALAVANLLVGNSPTEGALELTALGPTIRFESDNIFALAGADFSPTLNGVPVPTVGRCPHSTTTGSRDCRSCRSSSPTS